MQPRLKRSDGLSDQVVPIRFDHSSRNGCCHLAVGTTLSANRLTKCFDPVGLSVHYALEDTDRHTSTVLPALRALDCSLSALGDTAVHRRLGPATLVCESQDQDGQSLPSCWMKSIMAVLPMIFCAAEPALLYFQALKYFAGESTTWISDFVAGVSCRTQLYND